ncbi:MAG: hypothetical protein WA614_08565 [Acidimicrobiales bacterium]
MADAPLEAGLAHFTLIDVAVPLARTARGAEGPPAVALAGDVKSADVKSPANAAAQKAQWRHAVRSMDRLLLLLPGYPSVWRQLVRRPNGPHN